MKEFKSKIGLFEVLKEYFSIFVMNIGKILLILCASIILDLVNVFVKFDSNILSLGKNFLISFLTLMLVFLNLNISLGGFSEEVKKAKTILMTAALIVCFLIITYFVKGEQISNSVKLIESLLEIVVIVLMYFILKNKIIQIKKVDIFFMIKYFIFYCIVTLFLSLALLYLLKTILITFNPEIDIKKYIVLVYNLVNIIFLPVFGYSIDYRLRKEQELGIIFN